MINQQLLDYIKESLGKGVSQEQISGTLVTAGWKKEDVVEALRSTNPETSKVSTNLAALKPSAGKPFKLSFKSRTFIILVSVIGVLLIGGGVFAYFYYYLQTPEKIIGKMMNNLGTLKAGEYSGNIQIDYRLDNSLVKQYNLTALASTASSSHLTINFSGTTDNNTPDNIKNRLAIDLSSDIFSGKELSLGLETLLLDKTFYLKINNLPDLGMINVDFLKNQWVKIPMNPAENGLGSISGLSSSTPPSVEQIAKLKTLFGSSNIFQVSVQLPDENINGLNSYHYKLIINRNNLQSFLLRASEIMSNKKPSEAELTQLKDGLAKADFPDLEVWIGKQDYLPTKLFFTSNVKGSDDVVIGNMSLTLFFKNFNKIIELKAPESFKTLEEIIKQVFSNFSAPLTTSSVNIDTSDDINSTSSEMFKGLEEATSSLGVETVGTTTVSAATIDSDNDGLSDYEELNIYHTDPLNSDTDGDGFLDGAEAKAGYNPRGSGKLLK